MKLYAVIFCLVISVSAVAQGSDTARNDTSLAFHLGATKSKLDSSDMALIVVNGVIYKHPFNTINLAAIADIKVLKGKNATDIYGSKAAAGAIIIKSNNHGPIFIEKKDTSKSLVVVDAKPISRKQKPLIIVDGKVYRKKITSIDPKTVINVQILKGKEAARYGQKAVNGVIVITTKK